MIVDLSIIFDYCTEKSRRKIIGNITERFWMVDNETDLLAAHSCGIERSVRIPAWRKTADRAETMRPWAVGTDGKKRDEARGVFAKVPAQYAHGVGADRLPASQPAETRFAVGLTRPLRTSSTYTSVASASEDDGPVGHADSAEDVRAARSRIRGNQHPSTTAAYKPGLRETRGAVILGARRLATVESIGALSRR